MVGFHGGVGCVVLTQDSCHQPKKKSAKKKSASAKGGKDKDAGAAAPDPAEGMTKEEVGISCWFVRRLPPRALNGGLL